ncbi:MAG: ATP-binding protein [Eubacterium sp.]|nr:ATP-binding protein [Eubacterium sp.]
MNNNGFIGREREMEIMESLFAKDSFQMLILYGRRRVGKSRLLKEFMNDKKCIYYMSTETSVGSNLRSFSECIFKSMGSVGNSPEFRSFEDAFSYIISNSDDKKQVIVIDEFPYLAEADASILSVFQRIIDTTLADQNIFLVLCGSSIRFMQEDVLSEKSPLFGRRTAQLELKPFDYIDSAKFVPRYTNEEKAIVYGVTGGVAKYLEQFDDEKSMDENIEKLFFDESGYMYEEPTNLLRQEFRNTATYATIIEAMATGSTKMNEISTKTGIQTAALSKTLSNLISVRIAQKFIPLLNEKSKNQSGYIIVDSMFSFWYRFVFPARDAIELGHGDVYYKSQVRQQLHDYMAFIFEKMCREYTLEKGLTGQFGTIMTQVGKWSGTDKRKKEQADIDVIAINKNTKEAVIGECKFRNKKMSLDEAQKCVDRAMIPEEYDVKQILLFSLGGFAKDIKKIDNRIRTIGIDELYY